MSRENKNLKTSYLFLVALAKRMLKEANDARRDPEVWPRGESWNQLSKTSKVVLFRRASKEAGVSYRDYADKIRRSDCALDAISG